MYVLEMAIVVVVVVVAVVGIILAVETVLALRELVIQWLLCPGHSLSSSTSCETT